MLDYSVLSEVERNEMLAASKQSIQMISPSVKVIVFTDIAASASFLKNMNPSVDALILLDVNFPFISGWEFLAQYHQFQIQSKVIVLASSIDTFDRDKAHKYPMVIDYMTKPLSLEIVKEILQA